MATAKTLLLLTSLIKFTISINNSCPCAGYTKHLPNLLDRGFDSLNFNTKERIFNFTTRLCRKSQDGVYLIPDQQKLITVDFNSKNIIDVDVLTKSYVPLSFTGADKYPYGYDRPVGMYVPQIQKMKKILRDNVIVRVQLRKPLFRIELLNTNQRITDKLETELLQISDQVIKSNDDLVEYYADEIIQNYGTRYVKSVTLGGLLAIETVLPKKFTINYYAFKAMFAQRFNLNSTYNFTNVANYAADVKAVAANKSSIFVFGGQYANISKLNASEWFKTIALNPAKIDQTFGRFLDSTLMIPIPSQVLEMVRVNLLQAILRYSRYNMYSGCTDQNAINYISYAVRTPYDNCNVSAIVRLTFGGVYQICEEPNTQHNLCKNLNQRNPLTKAFTCPEDFREVKLLSRTIRKTIRVDYSPRRCAQSIELYNPEFRKIEQKCLPEETIVPFKYKIYWCYANPKLKRDGLPFGGIYTSRSINPHTGSKSCPQGYQLITIDQDINICFGKPTADFDPTTIFGGFFVYFGGNVLLHDTGRGRGNPLAKLNTKDSTEWPMRCPKGYVDHFAKVSLDYSIRYCTFPEYYKDKDKDIYPLLSVPGFGAKPVEVPGKDTLLLIDHFDNIFYRTNKTQPWMRAMMSDDLKNGSLEDLYNALQGYEEEKREKEDEMIPEMMFVMHSGTKGVEGNGRVNLVIGVWVMFFSYCYN